MGVQHTAKQYRGKYKKFIHEYRDYNMRSEVTQKTTKCFDARDILLGHRLTCTSSSSAMTFHKVL